MFIKLKAGEPLNRSNYRLFADIFVNIIAAAAFSSHSLLSYNGAVLYSSLILLEHRYL